MASARAAAACLRSFSSWSIRPSARLAAFSASVLAPPGEPSVRVAGGERLSGFHETSLEVGDGGADRGSQSGVVLVRADGLPLGLLRTERQLSHPLGRLSGLGSLLLDLAGRLSPLPQGRPQRCQDGHEGGDGLAYGSQAGPVGGQAEICGTFGESDGGPLRAFGGLGEDRSPLGAALAGPTHGLGGGGGLDVCPGEGAVIRYVGQLGVEGTAAGGDGLRLSLDGFRLLLERNEFGAQLGDPGPARALPGTLADVLGGRLGPTAGECTDPEAAVPRHPGRRRAVRAGADGGEQPGDCLLAHRRGLYVIGVRGRAEQLGERGPVDRSGCRGEQGVVPVGGENVTVGKHPRVQQPGCFQRRFQTGPLRCREPVVEVHQAPQRRPWQPLAQPRRAGGQGLGRPTPALLQGGELLAYASGAGGQLRPPARGFGGLVGQAGRRGAVSAGRVHAGRVGPVEVSGPLLEFVQQAGRVGIGEFRPGQAAVPYVVEERPADVGHGLLRPQLCARRLVELGVGLVEA